MRVALVVAVWVALGATARADDRTLSDRTVGVVVQGEGSLGKRIESEVTERLQRDGYTANDEPLSKGALDTIANCFIIEDLVCARGVFEARSRTLRLVFVRIDDTTGATTLDITWFSKGREPTTVKRACSECSRTWREHTADLMEAVSAQAQMPIVTAAEPDPEAIQPRSKVWSRVLVGAGVVAALTGGVLIYYGLRDGSEHKYVYPSLTPVGITAFAVGGGAMIGGIITW